MENFIKDTFEYYCKEILEARKEFTDKSLARMDILVNDRRLLNESVDQIDQSRKRLFNAVDCLSVIVNHCLDIPRQEARVFVLRKILPDLTDKGKVELISKKDLNKTLSFDVNQKDTELQNSQKFVIEAYSKIRFLGCRNPYGY